MPFTSRIPAGVSGIALFLGRGQDAAPGYNGRCDRSAGQQTRRFFGRQIPETCRDSTMKLSARNVLKGTILKIVPGSVNSEVFLEIASGPTSSR